MSRRGPTVNVSRMLVATLGAACLAAVGSPAIAQADAALNGQYTVVGGDEATFGWTAASACGGNGCTANIASNRGWTSVGTYTNGRLAFTVTKPDGFVCADGSFAPVVISYEIDAASLAGVGAADSNGQCPGGVINRVPFQLRKIA